MRAALDANVLISGLLAPKGAPAELLRAWQAGSFDMVVSPLLLDELEQALAYPKLRKRIYAVEAEQFVASLRSEAEVVSDPIEQPTRGSRDAGDDYLLALAERERAALVSGDEDLLELHQQVPLFSPAAFIQLLDDRLG